MSDTGTGEEGSETARCIIPARGGSKGVPRKNVRDVSGKPLLAYTVEAAQRATQVEGVVVSTEDAEIASVARRYGAEVIDRPASLAGDEASSEAALLHALDTIEEREGGLPDVTVFAQCTAPLTAPEDFDGTVSALREKNADSAVAAARSHSFLWKRGRGGAAGVNHEKTIRLRRQDRREEAQYLEAGAVYAMRTRGFRDARHRFFGKTVLYEMPAERVWEIDDPRDLVVAEALLNAQRDRRDRARLPDPLEAIVFDFDGVFTDNKVIVFRGGKEAVRCDRGDGMGIELLRETLDIPLWVLSREEHPVLKARCKKLGLPCVHGVEDKLPLFESWLGERGIDPAHTIFVGNDVNDIPCLQAAGCGVAVQDAHPTARAAADIVLARDGGDGAIRELSDLLTQHA